MSPELSRLLPLDRLGSRPYDIEVRATPEECAAVAARLMVPAVLSLSCRFRLRRDAADSSVVLAEGELAARAEQICVVTLEPFAQDVAESFRIRFIPDSREPADEDPAADDELVYELAVIDLGEAAVQQLALALDPFPRSPGATLPELEEPEPSGPFAALAAGDAADARLAGQGRLC